MATKAGLLATINGFITAIITQAKHRSSMSVVVDEMYATEVVDSNVSQTYTTKGGTNLNYTITIVKSGNIAHISGIITNNLEIALPNPLVFTWKDTEFKPKSSTSIEFSGLGENNLNKRIFFNNSVFGFYDSVASEEEIFFDFKTYITQP